MWFEIVIYALVFCVGVFVGAFLGLKYSNNI